MKVAVVGYGALKIGRYPDKTEKEMAIEVIKLALEDAGLSKKDIDGLYTTPDLLGSVGLQNSQICEYMRISPKSMAEICCGGTAAGLAVKYAMDEIMLGYVDIAVCYGAVREATIGWFRTPTRGLLTRDPIAIQPYVGSGIIWAYAMSARRYMYETGAKEEHFALACVRNRKGAMHNPWAAFTTPITVDDVLKSKILCSPIKLLDASASLDGAAAIVLASEEKAKKLTDTPIYIIGVGEYHDNSRLIPTDRCDKSISTFIAPKKAAEDAFKRAKLKPEDVDVAEIYAPFSPHELILPEDLGFFKRGEMVKAIEDGLTEIGGKIPINTDGGLLSRGHPWAATPFYETINIVRQLRGEAGKIQVKGAEVGLMHCGGGMMNSCVVLIFKRGD